MTKPTTIAEILALGRMEFATPDGGWRAADLGLRGEVIEAALAIHPADKLHASLIAGGAVVFRDDALGLVVRWSPE
jgi:hypothetical protein